MKKTLDFLDYQSIMPVTTPTEDRFQMLSLAKGNVELQDKKDISLCGMWQMAESGFSVSRRDITKSWADAHNYIVPGSIHNSLFIDGTIPDPLVAENDRYAREESYKVWWTKKEFDYDFTLENPQLVFDGVCYSALFYLNGVYLGKHRGMFSKVVFDVKTLLQKHNVLIVKIDDAPALPRAYSDDADFDDGWKFGTVINCVYGWHYACIPSRGIWAPVYLREKDVVTREAPFIATADTQKGEMDISMKMEKNVKGQISIEVLPKNFEGKSSYYTSSFDSGEEGKIHFHFVIPNHKLWWPNCYGEQNLYTAKIECLVENGSPSYYNYTFGIRTVKMEADVTGEEENNYNWQMVVNGKKIFMKGANWCTIDALLRFEESKYDRLLTLAKDQHLNLLRAWGCGMPESDYFYERCDELGLMVMQEWPTAWDSDKTQPFDEMHDTVIENMLRFRNHPSLAMYAGGNESWDAHSPVMDDMIRSSYQYDGTRPFHRTSPYGNKVLHSYATYWMQEGIDATLKLDSTVLFEFGMASSPNVDSVKKYIPEAEKDLWELRGEHNSFVHHTPRFNQYVDWPYGYNDIDHLTKYLGNFYDEANLEHFVTGTQLAQCTIYKHPIENYRSNYPYSTGVSYYKLNDVYPAASWATLDYYGAPKISHYTVKDAFRPLHPCMKVRSVDIVDDTVLPVYLLNDNGEKADNVLLKIYDNNLKEILVKNFPVNDYKDSVSLVGEIKGCEFKKEGAIIITLDALCNGKKVSSTFYWFNFKDDSGCLFRLPSTTLTYKPLKDDEIEVINMGEFSAVGVVIDKPDYNDTFYADEGLFFLEKGEKKRIKVNSTSGLRVRSFNSNWEEKKGK